MRVPAREYHGTRPCVPVKFWRIFFSKHAAKLRLRDSSNVRDQLPESDGVTDAGEAQSIRHDNGEGLGGSHCSDIYLSHSRPITALFEEWLRLDCGRVEMLSQKLGLDAALESAFFAGFEVSRRCPSSPSVNCGGRNPATQTETCGSAELEEPRNQNTQ